MRAAASRRCSCTCRAICESCSSTGEIQLVLSILLSVRQLRLRCVRCADATRSCLACTTLRADPCMLSCSSAAAQRRLYCARCLEVALPTLLPDMAGSRGQMTRAAGYPYAQPVHMALLSAAVVAVLSKHSAHARLCAAVQSFVACSLACRTACCVVTAAQHAACLHRQRSFFAPSLSGTHTCPEAMRKRVARVSLVDTHGN